MADFISDGMTRVSYVPSIANISAPTTTELNAGILLQSFITSDGLVGFEVTTSTVDNTALNSTFDTLTIGRDQYSGTKLTFKKQLSGDIVFTTLIRGLVGFIVIRRDITESTAWTSTQPCETYPVIFGQRRRLSPGANTLMRWESDCPIVSSPSLAAAVA